MNTRRRRQLLAAAIAVVLSCTGDTHVGCSPTLTCTLRPGRFAPPPGYDAGPQTCDLGLRRCAASQVSAGDGHTCVVTDAGSLICWGDDSEGQRGVTLDELSSRRASSISEGFDPESDAGAYLASASRVVDGAKQVTTGAAHSCALLKDGSVSCWGRNVEGQVGGSGEAAMLTAPTDTGVTGATQIDAGASHTCAVVEAGVMCWGSGKYGQSGRAQSADPLPPALVPDTESAVEVSCGVRHTCARSSNGEVRCWGELIDESGAPQITPDPTPMPELRALGISAGAGQSCALTEAFAVVCWGNNDSGQLGDGTFAPRATPVGVLGFEAGAGQVAAGGGELDGRLVGHSCAIDKSAQVACWGRSAEGQLGVGLGDDRANPQAVLLSRVFNASDQPTLGNAQQLALGAFHSCSVGSQGSLFCWGDDRSQQLGTGLMADERDVIEDSGVLLPGRARRVRRFGSMR